ncbi:MAG: hypothetical protein K6F87_07330, partial [Lachnospiraceae bacterium]|nr:hypothetical protein [Lachnospiraceae bacterium]
AGDLKIECLSPKDGAFQNGAGFDANDASLVLKLSYIGNGKVQNDQVLKDSDRTGFSGIFTGDISDQTERSINSDLSDAVYLKVAHHGSRTSTSEMFLKSVRPKICVISVGEDNSYGHPAPEVITRLQNSGCRIFRTDMCGEVITVYDEGKLGIRTQGGL